MNEVMLCNEILRTAEVGVLRVGRVDQLRVLHRLDCAAVIWDRPGTQPFLPWLRDLAPGELPRGRIVVRPGEVTAAVTRICNISGMPDGEERGLFIADVSALADRFIGLMDAPYLRIRFDVEQTNACRKFHVDAVTARLVCTYRGTGTQYGVLADQTEPSRIHTVPTGAPILMRGTQWPEQPMAGLRHRSPPIEGSGETRLLMVLDPLSRYA